MNVSLGLVIGVISDLFYRRLANRVIEYKLRKKERPVDNENKAALIITYITMPIMTTVAFLKFPVFGALLACLIYYAAALTVYVDERMRIIPNELMLAIFILDNILILASGGVLSYFSAIMSLLLITGVFALTMFIGRLVGLPANGIGAGDLKFLMVVAYYSGMENIVYFFIGFAVTTLIRILIISIKTKYTAKFFFPMGFHIFFGMATICIVNFIGADVFLKFIDILI